MATVNKNFRIKNGLVVEGSTATVNGFDILTKASADQTYIIDLIGGQATSANTANTVVKRDGSGDFSAGTITANLVGNVTGTVSSLSNHDTDDLSEGTSNKYFTDTRAKQSAASLLTSATKTNITISGDENGLTITAENGVADSDTDDLDEGSVNLYFTDTRARAAISGGTGINYNSGTGVIAVDSTIATKTYADTAADNAVNALDTDDIEEGTNNLYFTNQRALNATSAAYDAVGAAATAQSNAETYADGAITSAINALDTDDIEEGISNQYFTNTRARNALSSGTGISYDSSTGAISVTANTYDAYGAASTAEDNANDYTDNAINALDTDDIEEGAANQYFTNTRARGAVSAGSGLNYNSGTGEFSVDTTTIANKSYVDTAITNLIDGAPGLLDTLNEIAAAINDDANFFTTISNNLAGKLSLSGGTMTGDLTLTGAPTQNLHAATKQYVDTAESNAVSTAESYADGLKDDILDGTSVFTAVNLNDVAKQVAVEATLSTTNETTAYSWPKADFRTAKFLVKFAYGSHTDVSEVLLTLDTSDNVAITEYAIVTTNGSLGTVTADVNNNDVRLRVTAGTASTDCKVMGTLLQ